uniref:GILT-like protein C02D5.2 n=1 Tax=Lygus hesperus TaxID=30085 RepID=A0A0A9X529_LYGHE
MKQFIIVIAAIGISIVHTADSRRRFKNNATPEQPKPKVRLQIYFESKCPDSKRFFGSQLTPMMDKIGDYIQLELHPYGKAKTNETTGEVRCQHGAGECQGNMVDACGIVRLNNGTEQTQFVNCMFENSNIPLPVGGQYCCDQYKLDWVNEVQPCSEGPEGKELHHKHGEETNSLDPPVSWVPVIILNNKRGDEEYQKILTNYILQETCSQLTKMNNRPPGC